MSYLFIKNVCDDVISEAGVHTSQPSQIIVVVILGLGDVCNVLLELKKEHAIGQ